MKTMMKLLCLALVLAMCFSIVACKKDEVKPTPTPAPGASASPSASGEGPNPPPSGEVDMEAYGKKSKELYDQILGEFYKAYQVALSKEDISERFAYMAVAEAKLLESGVMMPSSSNGGTYAISRAVPYTASSVLWGNDNDRFYKMLVVTNPITSEDRAALKAIFAGDDGKTEAAYLAAAKAYLTGKGYTFKNTYDMPYASDPQTWDILATSRAADSEAIVNTICGLLEYDIKNNQVPALAEAMPTVSADGLTYTFKIRQGVKWVDSTGKEIGEVKAADFVAGLQHLLDAKGGLEGILKGVIAGAGDYIDGVETDFAKVGVKAEGDYTLVYTLEKPCTYFLSMMGYGMFSPLFKDYYEAKGGKFGADYDPSAESYMFGKNPDSIAYCGPYVVTNATEKNTIKFEANAKYWDVANVNVKTLTWHFNDGQEKAKAYNDMKSGVIDGAALNSTSLELARQDKVEGTDKTWFDTYHYVTSTDATAFMAFMNINRTAYANVQDKQTASSIMKDADKERSNKAVLNQHFRTAIMYSLDRAAYNAQTTGEDLKLTSLINSFTPGNFVKLEKEVTLKIGDTDKTYAAGTFYGAIMQDQITADGFKYKVWDPQGGADGLGSSAGFDGWHNVEEARKELALAIAELGIEVTKENPIMLDLPCFAGNEAYKNRANAFKLSLEAALEGKVVLNLVECATAQDWYNAGYYTDYGYDANYSIYDVSGWGPDYGDPASYLDAFLPDYDGYMTKCLGIY